MWQVNKHPFIKSGLLTGFLLLNLGGPQAYAARTDQNFREYLRFQCENSIEFVSTLRNFVLCTNMFQGNYAEPPKGRDSIMLPTGNDTDRRDIGKPDLQPGGVAGSNTVSGGAEDGGFGILVTGLSGNTERVATENENKFTSDLSGYVLGLDYQLSDSFIFGMTLSSTEDEADIANDAGEMKTESDAHSIYATWVPVDNMSMDFYLGNSDADIAYSRLILVEGELETVSGIAAGSFKNSQDFQGASINYDWYMGDWSVGVLAAYDSIETEIDGYSEQGSTALELSFPDQATKSVTTSFGLRSGYAMGFGWGSMIPSVKVIQVKEHEADARTITVALASAPDGVDPFTVVTDAPDREYQIGGFGMVAAFNGGGQIFVDYEKRSGHEFIETSSVTAGILFPF